MRCPSITSLPVALRAIVALTLLVLAAGLAPAGASAAGTPNLALAVDAQDSVLYGSDSTVRFTASTPAASADAYNLSYRAVLPVGITYVAGSAGALLGEPTSIVNQPAAGQTTLLWVNVADLAGGTAHALDFQVRHSTAGFGVQGNFTIRGDAYAMDNAAYVPAFTAQGVSDTGVANPRTAFAENVTDMTRISSLTVTKTSEDTPDDELLRGVHDNQTIYTITVKTNSVAGVTSTTLFDYLPAGIEFLGCGGAGSDHTTNAPTNPGSAEEYPGAGPITVPVTSGCLAPITVQTSTFDPDQTGTAFGNGVYTQVRWNLGTLNANTTTTVRFRAAIPLRRNVGTWPGAAPSIAGAQAANLGNNSGTEVADEELLTSYSAATGFYNGSSSLFLTGDTTTRRYAEDLAVKKTARTSGLAQGTPVLWDLDLRTSEYRDGSGVVVTDTVPDGLCPLQNGVMLTSGPPTAADTADCLSGGPTPSVPYTSTTENPDGTWSVVWDQSTDPDLAQLAPSSTHTITFPTNTRANYQDTFEDIAPVLAGDSVTNAVAVAGTARVVCATGAACPPGPATGTEIAHDGGLSAAVTDVSSDRLTAAVPTLDKTVATTSADCTTAVYTDGASIPPYRPGDRVCWQLRIAYPSLLQSADDTIVDYLPSTLAFDPVFGTLGEEPTANDTAGAGAVDATGATPGPGGELRWNVPTAYVDGSKVFERRVATRVQLPAGAAVGDVSTNLFKSSTRTSSGGVVPLRDSAPYKLTMPVMSAQKRVVALNGANLPTPVATQVVRGGDVATFRVQLSNTSNDTAAERAEVWDRLPAGVTCADVTASGGPISDAGICDPGDDTIKWGATPTIGPDISPTGNIALTYDVRVPTTTRPTQALTSSAGIRQFQTTTNTGGAFTYVPSSNIDPTLNASANVGPAGSTATLTGAEPTISESRTTSITESAGAVTFNGNGEATIGETIHYTVTTTLRAGLTVDNFKVTDTVDARHIFLPGTLALTTGTVPGGGAFGPTGSDIELSLGAAWTAPTGADSTYVFEFDAIVADTVANFRGGLPMTNQAKLGYDNPAAPPARNETLGAAVTTTLVEPALSVDKTVDVGTTPVIGGEIVEYTVRVSNGSGSVNPAHETTLVDLVPDGLTPVDLGGAPVADGAIVPDNDPALVDGTWDEATHTITFAPDATIDPGSTNTFKYRTSVDIPPVAGTSLTNTASATTTNIAATPTLPAMERTIASPVTTGYTASDTVTLTAKTASVTSSPSPATLTPGEQTTYTLTVSIPANTVYYDTYVKDVLPPEMEFDAHVSQICTAGCTAPTTPNYQMYTPVTSGGNTQIVAFDLGDLLPSASATRTIELKYKAHLRLTRRGTGTAITRPSTVVSTATVASNRTDRVGAFDAATLPAPAGGFNDTSPAILAASSSITVIEPVMAIEKQIAVNSGSYGTSSVTVHDGDVMHYRVTVRNTGDAPAHDIVVRDVPPATFRNVVMATGVSTDTNNDPWAAPGDDIGWLIPGPIAPNGSVVLDYTADLPAVTSMRDNDLFTNTVTIQDAWGVSLADRTLRPTPQFGYRSYSVATIPALTRSTTAIYDAPTISVNKTTGISPSFPDNGPTQIGALFTWRVSVTNTSSTASAKNLTVTDTLPKDWDYEPGSTLFTAGSTANPTITSLASGDQLVWNTTIPLAPGASVVLTYQARATLASATSIGTGTAPAARHINSATASVLNHLDRPADANGPFAPAAPDTSYAYLAVPVITVAKTPDAAPMPGAAGTGATVTAGTVADFFIKVRNTGSAPATNVIVTDTLPVDGISSTFTSGSATATPSTGFTQVSANDTTATFRIASLAVGATVDIRVPVNTDPAAAENSEIVNTASVASDESAAVVDTGTFRQIGSADLLASKTAPAAVNASQSLAYTVSARNLGPSVARTIVLTDVLPLTVSFRPSPGCGYTSASRTVTCTFIGATNVGATVSATINTRVNSGVNTNANNSVTALSTTADPVSANNTATALVDVGEVVELSIVKTITGGTAGATTADPWTKRVARGDQVSFPLTFVNAGPSDALSAQVVDTLPAGLTYVSDTGGCTYDGPTRTLTCPISGGLPVHEPSAPAVPSDPGAPQTITVVTTATGLGTQTNSAVISGGSTAEAAPADNTDTAVVMVDPAINLGLTMTAPATVAAGGLLTYTLTGTNTGKDDATDATFTVALPAGTTFESATASANAGCTLSAPGQLTCALGTVPGRGPSGAGPVGSVVRNVTVRVPIALAEQAITSNASFASTETAISTTDSVVPVAASASTQVGPSADLTITQNAPTDVGAGGSITYTIVVRNDGPSSAPAVTVTDQLPAGVTLNLATSSTGSCTVAGGVVTCALGALASGTSTVLTITVDVPEAMAGQTLANAASVSSTVVDPTPSNASSSITRQLRAAAVPPPSATPTPAPGPEPSPGAGSPAQDTPPGGGSQIAPPGSGPAASANLALAKKAEGVARAGRELSYTITATNRGPAVATEVVVTDALVGGVEFKSARAGDGKCGFDEGTVRCKTAKVAVGETVNIRVIVVPSRTGMLVNDAVVSSDVSDPDMGDNRAFAANTVSARPPTKLTIKKTGSSTRLRGGQRVTYTLKVKNVGGSEAAHVEVCDRLPAPMAFTSTKGGVLKGSRLCFTKASLMPGRTAVFKVRVRLSPRARRGKIVNRASADAENAAQQNTSATAQVITDGRVSAGMVRGFTG